MTIQISLKRNDWPLDLERGKVRCVLIQHLEVSPIIHSIDFICSCNNYYFSNSWRGSDCDPNAILIHRRKHPCNCNWNNSPEVPGCNCHLFFSLSLLSLSLLSLFSLPFLSFTPSLSLFFFLFLFLVGCWCVCGSSGVGVAVQCVGLVGVGVGMRRWPYTFTNTKYIYICKDMYR